MAPAYNEEEVIEKFYLRTRAVLQQLNLEWEIVFANDGSHDRTPHIIRRLMAADDRIGMVDLSRNFGKEIALTAGLDHAAGDAVVVIDCDLQDPPELIIEFVRLWEAEGYDVIYAQRTSRTGESAIKRGTAYLFYRLMNGLSDRPIPTDTGDFRLMSRRALDALLQAREHHRFMKGLFAWVGFRQIAVPYAREPRAAGESKWNYWKLWNFSIEGITSFSIRPLQLSSYFGFVTALVAVVYGSFMILRTIFYGNPVAGYPSLLVIVLFLGGVQLLSIGIIGEYLGRMFNETKRRPLYFTQEILPSRVAVQRAVSRVDVA